MPFTPFHFGPSATIAFPLKGKIDIPIFILANVAIDIEPLTVIMLNLSYPLHGYIHSFLGAGLVGTLWGLVGFKGKGILREAMQLIGLRYETTMKTAIISGILGAFSHVLLDAPIYADIKPLYPLTSNPLYGLVSENTMYLFCSILCIPAFLLYLRAKNNEKNTCSERITPGDAD
jgi:membrane-bound metal-dependent hydrolase YbcI (DUF457 family)